MRRFMSGIIVCIIFFNMIYCKNIIPVKALSQIPEMGTVIYSEDFSNSDLDSRIITTTTDSNGASTGTVTVTDDGALEIWKDPANKNWVGVDIHLYDDKSGFSDGELVSRFKLRRFSSMPIITARMCSAENQEITRVYWGNKTVSGNVTYSDTEGRDDTQKRKTTIEQVSTEITVTTYYNFNNNTVSMWFNNTLVFEDKYPSKAAADNLSYIRIYTEQASTKFYVDDFICYTVERVSDEDFVRMDSDSLTYKSIFADSEVIPGVIGSDLEFPSMGMNGCEITWESSDEALISADGKVTLADESYDVSPEVTLTATITHGEISEKKSFTVKVIKASELPRIPEVGTVIYSEDFSASDLDSRIITTTTDSNGASTGTVTVTDDGTLEIWKDPANKNWVGVDIHLYDDKSGFSDGELVSRFKLRRFSSMPVITARMCSAENQEITRVYWGNKTVSGNVTYSDTEGRDDTQKRKTTIEQVSTEIIVTTYYNFNNNTVSMWFNNILVFEDKYPSKAAADNLSYIRIYTEQAGARFFVDDMIYYNVEKISDEELVRRDSDSLTYESIFSASEVMTGVIDSDLKLPVRGKNGCEITWKSSDESLICADGKVTLADESYDVSPEVTLTATITRAGVSEKKSFVVKVLKASDRAPDMPQIDNIIYSNDFSSENLGGNHYSLDESGGDIFVEDGVLKIVRKEDVGTTIADIYPDKNHGVLTGIIGVSYTATKPSGIAFSHRFRKVGTNDFAALTWYGDGSVVCIGPESSGNIACGTYHDTLTVDIVFNTHKGIYSLWLNGKAIAENKPARNAPGDRLGYLRFFLERTGFGTVTLDDLKVYTVKPTNADIAEMDYQWLNYDKIMTDSFVRDNIINSDLKLICEGKYGSEITWTSSDSKYISDEGKITPPVDTDDFPEITLTASIRAGGIVLTKEFEFKVHTVYSSVEKLFEMETALITEQTLLSQGQTDPMDVRCSLNLTDTTPNGLSVSWKSDNTKVITDSGRVIRPRNDQKPEDVVLTATFSSGDKSVQKEYSFRVTPDEKWTDPGYMSDEEFFGKWENDSWSVVGKLDYSVKGLSYVENAVKNGNYPEAKEELLKHMRLRNPPALGLGARESGYAQMAIADVHSLQHSEYYQGAATISSTDYEAVRIDVKSSEIAKGGSTSYGIAAKYNESSEVNIASVLHSIYEYRPKIEMKVNGTLVTYDACESLTIRAGKYSDTNYSDSEDLSVKMFGSFLSDETYKAMIKFDFGNLKDSDVVEDVTLILHARVKQSFAKEKEILVLYDPNNFDKNATWNTFLGYVYNYNGLIDGSYWEKPSGCEVEFYYQSPRFYRWPTLAAEYAFTEDEKYAYYMLWCMMDFIRDKGGQTNSGSGWPSNKVIMAGHPRTLDTSSRMTNWVNAMTYLVKSDYMTPEVCTAILKTIWHMTDSLTYSTLASGNWMQAEKISIIKVALAMPEFSKAQAWLDDAVSKYEKLFLETNNFPDGSYLEKTGGYSQGSLTGYINFKKTLQNSGMDVSDEYDEMLLKSAYYNIQLYGPGGIHLQWGDEGAGKRASGLYLDLVKWYNDKNLEYISTFGVKGEKPGWTSMQYPDGRQTFMRSDWTNDALYMYTQVRGKGQHGHQDDNGVIAIAYGRILLPDSGIFTYDNTNPDRVYGISTRAHNTVEVNNTTQNPVDPGTLNSWVTNNSYDFLSQTSLSYSNVPHKRSIMFVKPDLWIVSDLMIPKNKTTQNSYKQLWHMLPNANLTTDTKNGLIYSDFLTGANIVIGSADKDATVGEEMGKYDYNYQQITDAKYGYFEKAGAGDVTFDTVLIPTRSGKAKLDVERLDTGVQTNEATAIKFKTDVDGEKNTYYYLLDYAHNSENERSFGKFTTNAEVMLVCENSKGNAERIILNNGSFAESEDGNIIFKYESEINDISLEKIGTKLYISTSEETLEGALINLANIKTVYVNGEATEFAEKADGSIILSDEEASVTIPTDSSNNKGGIGDRGSSAGGSFGGGTAITPPAPGINPGSESEIPFDDISGHWAKNNIISLYTAGVVNGDGKRRFNPEKHITRAEFLAMVIRVNNISGVEYQNSFTDVDKSDWYANIVQAALECGIISRDIVFRPDDFITREEMCKILVEATGEKLDDVDKDFNISFNDNDQISEWALDYVAKAAFNRLVNGMDNGNFEPKSSATRAEGATVIARCIKI